MLITNFMVGVQPLNILNPSSYTMLQRIGSGIFAFPVEKAPIPFVCFYHKEIYMKSLPFLLREKTPAIISSTLSAECFHSGLKVWLEKQGFINVQRTNDTPYWQSIRDEEGYIQAKKP